MRLIVQSADDAVLALEAGPEETLVAAAQRQGVTLPVDCLEGFCGACRMRVLDGQVEMAFCSEDALGEDEQAAGWVLACQSHARSDVVVASPALGSQLRGKPPAAVEAEVTGLDLVAKDTMALTLRLPAAMDFLPGQYARLGVPGTAAWRSYSFSSAPGSAELEFLIRLLPGGAMSEWLRQAAPGDTLPLNGPHGVFFARPSAAPAVMLAGGTGLGPMLSMLRAGSTPGATLLYGVNQGEELACLPELRARLGAALHLAVVQGAAGATTGFVTDLLGVLDARQLGEALFYLCGPPPMIDAARRSLAALGVNEDRLVCERFAASNEGTVP